MCRWVPVWLSAEELVVLFIRGTDLQEELRRKKSMLDRNKFMDLGPYLSIL